MIQTKGLYKSFGSTSVLRGMSFKVNPGEIAALVGPNGSGKTTTLHLLAGLSQPDQGTALVNGIDVHAHPDQAKEHLAFLPQEVRFHEALTPRQVLAFYAGIRQVEFSRIDDLLREVDLHYAADRQCGALSGGMRQRLGLALLKLNPVPVLLLDEPALSLDPEWRKDLQEWIERRAGEGAAVLMATHLLEIWRPITDRVFRCAEGTVVENSETSAPVHSNRN